LATLSSIADGGEGRGEEVLSFIESACSTILGFMEEVLSILVGVRSPLFGFRGRRENKPRGLNLRRKPATKENVLVFIFRRHGVSTTFSKIGSFR
jgi:hypothetical protein